MVLGQLIRRPVAVSLAAIGVILLGSLGYLWLPVAAFPVLDLPTLVVLGSLPGASPETMATSVATPLERRIGQIAGVIELTSVNVLGATQITVQLSAARDIAGAVADVQSAVNAASNELPRDMPLRPQVIKLNPALEPIIFFAVTCETLPPDVVYGYLDRVVVQSLSQVEGVSRVTIQGAQKAAVRVRTNPAMLANLGLGLDDVRAALAATNAVIPKGTIEGVRKSVSIAANDQLFAAKDYRSLPISNQDGTLVRLGDIGSVITGVVNEKVAGWYNEKPGMFIVVRQEAGANMVETAARVRAAMPQLAKWLPPAIKISLALDRTNTMVDTNANAQRTLLLSMIAVALVILLFLRDIRSALTPTIAIPISVIGTLGLMYIYGFTLNIISLNALMACVAFVVDDAIVVIENIARHYKDGISSIDAVLIGTRKVAFTIVAITGSLVAALLPLMLVPGVVGQYLREFSVTLSSAIVISAIISLTLTPVMCANFLKGELRQDIAGWRSRQFRISHIDRLAELIVAKYSASLRWVLARPLIIVAVIVAVTMATVLLYIFAPKGFMPPLDSGIIAGNTEASSDISFGSMSEHQKAVVQTIRDDPAVLSVVSYIGSATEPTATNNSRIFVLLKPLGERPSLQDVIARLRPQLSQIAGIKTYLQSVEDLGIGSREGKGQFQFTLQYDDWTELEKYSQVLADRLRDVPELVDVGTDQRGRGLQTFLEIDRDRASVMGVTPQAIDDALYSAFGQRQVSTVYTDVDQFEVILEAEQVGQRDLSELQRIWVTSTGGDRVPLSSVTRAVTKTTSLAVSHQGQLPASTITFNLAPNVALSTAAFRIRQEISRLRLPPGMRASFEGTALAYTKSSGSEPWLILAAVLTIYVVLGVLYESYIHPLTIISSLPTAGFGGLLALVICRQEFTLISFVGLILLLGIVKKNAIMMVNFALTVQHEGADARDAIYQACLLRFRPIVMTTVTALIGSLPLAFATGSGSSALRPFGIMIIGGLISSQILTLYTTPVIYLYMDQFGRWFRIRTRHITTNQKSASLESR